MRAPQRSLTERCTARTIADSQHHHAANAVPWPAAYSEDFFLAYFQTRGRAGSEDVGICRQTSAELQPLPGPTVCPLEGCEP